MIYYICDFRKKLESDGLASQDSTIFHQKRHYIIDLDLVHFTKVYSTHMQVQFKLNNPFIFKFS